MINRLFEERNLQDSVQFAVSVAEVYNNDIFDLLSDERRREKHGIVTSEEGSKDVPTLHTVFVFMRFFWCFLFLFWMRLVPVVDHQAVAKSLNHNIGSACQLFSPKIKMLWNALLYCYIWNYNQLSALVKITLKLV